MCSFYSFIPLVKPTLVSEMKRLPLATLTKHSNVHLKCINRNLVYKILISLFGELRGGKYMSKMWLLALEKILFHFFRCPQNTISCLLLFIKNSGLLFHFPKFFWITYLVWNVPLKSRTMVGYRYWRVLINFSIFVFCELTNTFLIMTLKSKVNVREIKLH